MSALAAGLPSVGCDPPIDPIGDAMKPPTARQLAYLRVLAERTGQTFVAPKSSGEASREIRRLKSTPASTGADRAVERERATDNNAAMTYGTAPRDDEIAGWGGRATWRSGR